LTPDKLKEIMHKLDFSTADVALIMGVTRRTVQLWLSGGNPPPASTIMVLEGILEGLLPMEWVEDKIIASMQIA
jgi:transcriptional regulator with XRE-family HTH domain